MEAKNPLTRTRGFFLLMGVFMMFLSWNMRFIFDWSIWKTFPLWMIGAAAATLTFDKMKDDFDIIVHKLNGTSLSTKE